MIFIADGKIKWQRNSGKTASGFSKELDPAYKYYKSQEIHTKALGPDKYIFHQTL